MVPPAVTPNSGPTMFAPHNKEPWSCGRQYSWRPAFESSSPTSAKATIQNLEKTIQRIDDALQNDLATLAEGESRKTGRIQYDKISVFPMKRSQPTLQQQQQQQQQQRLSPKPFPRSSSFFGSGGPDRAKSVVHQINPSFTSSSTSTLADRACSAPPAPPRLQNFSSRYNIVFYEFR
jgi:hypothetical protein